MTNDLQNRAAIDVQWLLSATRTMLCTDGIERRVIKVGAGPLLVCVPVLGSLNFLYAPQIRRLQEQRSVLAYEPVVSRSAPVSMAARVAELDAVIRTVGTTPVDILGWSDGGAVACSFAARFPSATRSLALVAVPRRFRPSLRATARLLSLLPIEKLATFDPVLRWSLAILARGPVLSSRAIVTHLRAIEAFVPLFKHSLLPLLGAHLVTPGSITAPALVVVGAHDRFVSTREARELVTALPDARDLVVIPDGEHFLTYASPDTLSAHLQQFLGSVQQ